MTPLAIGGLGLAALLLLILAQIPIGFAMMIVGIVGLALKTSWGPALTVLATEPVSVLSNVDLATVPLFLLMGTFATAAGLSAEMSCAGNGAVVVNGRNLCEEYEATGRLDCRAGDEMQLDGSQVCPAPTGP